MSMKSGTILSLALFAAIAAGSAAHARTIVKDTIIEQREQPGVRKMNFSSFDVNRDGQLSRNEVGETLFYIFDTDGNQVIDNLEYTKIMVLTIIPMEKKEITSIDFNDDGIADSKSYSQENFFQQSKLIRFDQNKNGLSAREFLDGAVYWQLDNNKDKTVDIEEWKRAYIASLTPGILNPNLYNR